MQIAGLGALHVLSCAVVYTAVSIGAGAVLGARPTATRVVGRVSGAVMLALGILLVAERLREAVPA